LGTCSKLLRRVDPIGGRSLLGTMNMELNVCMLDLDAYFMHVDVNDTGMLVCRCILTKTGHHTLLHTPGSSPVRKYKIECRSRTAWQIHIPVGAAKLPPVHVTTKELDANLSDLLVIHFSARYTFALLLPIFTFCPDTPSHIFTVSTLLTVSP
jgi:hypothetical protein